MTVFTTSWDDGYDLDRRMANMLSAHGCTGTFYACPASQHGQTLLTRADIRSIAERHEVGAHTITHPRLTALPAARAKEEIVASKRWVEEIAAKDCLTFCYPYGDHNDAVAAMVREAGFAAARTTEELRFDGAGTFAMPTSLQAYPFPWRPTRSRWWHAFDPLGRLRARYRPLRALGVPLSAMGSWSSLAVRLFDDAVRQNAPFFHLWGHTHEIEKYGMWDDVERFLAHVQASGVRPVTNGELAELLR